MPRKSPRDPQPTDWRALVDRMRQRHHELEFERPSDLFARQSQRWAGPDRVRYFKERIAKQPTP